MNKILKSITVPAVLTLSFILWNCQKQKILTCDICIYGNTSSGVIAACAASRMGKSVILVETSRHPGGLTSGGLGATDIGNKYAISGMARDFYRKLGSHYGTFEKWTFEPHIAENIFNQYLAGSNVIRLSGYRIRKAIKEINKIKRIILENSLNPSSFNLKTISAKIFIDCSYEGDLMARAKVSYMVGRESNTLYSESLNGFQIRDKHQFPDNIDPFIEPGNPKSGLVFGIYPGSLQPDGTGDKKVQAYNFRLCLTRDTSKRIPVTKPAKYDPAHYELLRRLINYRTKQGWENNLSYYMHIQEMPEGKTDINNNGPFSTDYINESWTYPDASYKKRQKIIREHENYVKGLLYFLGHDPSVPVELKIQMLEWGYAKDEFIDNGGFPYQMYVRESRRMIGEYVMTELNCTGDATIEDGIGMAAYTMDSHNCERIVVNGMVKNEGDVQVGGFPPYPVSYRSLTPRKDECTNLLVPVCLSASHIAYGSIRMEPVFMVLGQSCAIAACLAIEHQCMVQEIHVQKIQQILNSDPLLDGSIPEFIIDNSDQQFMTITGNWSAVNCFDQYKKDCLVAKGKSKISRRVRFTARGLSAGEWEVLYYCPGRSKEGGPWTNAAPVRISDGINEKTVIADLNANEQNWLVLGIITASAGSNTFVELCADTISRPVVADAVLFKPVKKQSEKE